MRKLNVFLDDHNILRVGGRLKHANLGFTQKHPAILPRNHRLTKLIIEHYHKAYMHPGAQTLQYLLRQQFWILSPKRAIRNVTLQCQSCWRVSPQPMQPKIGNLPEIRISQVKPFLNIAVDFAGPFL